MGGARTESPGGIQKEEGTGGEGAEGERRKRGEVRVLGGREETKGGDPQVHLPGEGGKRRGETHRYICLEKGGNEGGRPTNTSAWKATFTARKNLSSIMLVPSTVIVARGRGGMFIHPPSLELLLPLKCFNSGGGGERELEREREECLFTPASDP